MINTLNVGEQDILIKSTIYYNEEENINNINLFISKIYMFVRLINVLNIFINETIKHFISNIVNYFCNKEKNTRLDLIKNIVIELENINIVYVKIFQSLCIDKKILSNDEEEYLMKYLDCVPYKGEEVDYELLDILEKEYYITLDTSEPINSGIVSVVFKGEYNHKKVVIKMLKKNIHEKIENVFEELSFICNMLSYIPIIKEFNLNKILSSNKDLLINQINFVTESNNISIFNSKFKNNTEFIIPEVYKDITHKYNNVIVMENIKGLHYKDIKNLDPDIKDKFGKILFKFAVLSTLYHNAIHCDLHAGNIFFYINDDDSKKPKYQLGLIDFGIVTFPSKENQDGYYKFFFEIQLNKDFTNIDKIKYFLIK